MNRLIAQKDEIINKEKQKLSIMRHRYNMTRTLEKNDSIYIASTEAYARKYIFKIGKTSDLRSRISSYNTGRIDDDKMMFFFYEKCYNGKITEEHIMNLLVNFRINKRKEMVCVRFDLLVKLVQLVCDDHNNHMDLVNEILKQMNEDVSLEQECNIPAEIELPELKRTLAICSSTNGSTFEPIDTTDWNDEQYREFMKEVLSLFAKQKELEYNYDTDKNDTNKNLGEIKWSDILPILMKQLKLRWQKDVRQPHWKAILKQLTVGVSSIQKCYVSR
jgi:hypothetical protein